MDGNFLDLARHLRLPWRVRDGGIYYLHHGKRLDRLIALEAGFAVGLYRGAIHWRGAHHLCGSRISNHWAVARGGVFARFVESGVSWEHPNYHACIRRSL